MYCLKCGRETPEQQAFCPDCLKTMARYPVKPETPVQLPNRTVLPKSASRNAHVLTPEEQIGKLRAANRRLAVAVGVLCLALAVAAGAFLFFFGGREPAIPTGQNYSVRQSE